MILDLFSDEWAILSVATLAATFNVWHMRAERMGTIFQRYGAIIEAVNWVLLTGAIIFLAFNYSWYLLLTIWVFPAVGLPIAGILGSHTQIIYVVAMPILLAAFIIRVASCDNQPAPKRYCSQTAS